MVDDQVTAVLLDSDGVEMSEPVPVRYDGHDVVINHVPSASRVACAMWIEFRVPGHEPFLRAPIRPDYSSTHMELGDTMAFSPISISV